jgi:hypothetical protein
MVTSASSFPSQNPAGSWLEEMALSALDRGVDRLEHACQPVNAAVV